MNRLGPIYLWLQAIALAAVALPAHANPPGTNTVYAASGFTVQAIDTATNTVVGSATVPGQASTVVASKDGSRVYATHQALDSVSIIDAASMAVLATVPVGDAPSSAVVSPNGDWLYVLTTGGIVQVLDTVSQQVVAAIDTPSTATGGMAITGDGSRVYVASGPLSVIDATARTFLGAYRAGYHDVEVLPDGSRVYAVRVGTSASGVIDVSDGTGATLIKSIATGSPLALAMAVDGSRLYLSVNGQFVGGGSWTGGFFTPGRFVSVIDTITNTIGAQIDFGNDTAVALTTTPNRKSLYASLSTGVGVANVSTNTVVALVPMLSPGALSASGDAGYPEPYVIDAVDDVAPASISTGPAVANVLQNDKLGGIRPTVLHVTLTEESTSDPYVTLDTATGAVVVAFGATAGPHTLVYRICEIASPGNCDSATVTLTVREPYVIDAVDDVAASLPNRVALASVLANDTLNGAPATLANVRLTQVSTTAATLSLNPNTGAVTVGTGTPGGTHYLVYRICEAASLFNCDEATVTVTVTPFSIDAVDDSGTTTRGGGIAVYNVLANDLFNGTTATTSTVRLGQVSSTNAGVSLNTTTGSVSVAYGTPMGTHQLVYRICEAASPTNCDQATVTVTVTAYVIDAVDDSVRAYSKPTVATVILPSVLANDSLGGQRPTTAQVRLTQVSSGSPNLVLNTSTGAVTLLKKTDSGLYTLVYRICEIANATNCDQATVNIDLSGKTSY